MANPSKTYKPLPSHEDQLLKDVPAGWKTTASPSSDPLDGIPHPSYKPRFPTGKCKACGEELPELAPGTRGPKPTLCADCKPRVRSKQKAAQKANATITRAAVGVVPFRASSFVWDTRAFIWELKTRYGDKVQTNQDRVPKKTDKVVKDEVTGKEVRYTTGFGSYLSGEWEGVWSEGVFEDISRGKVLKGIKPEQASHKCDVCGGALHVELPRARDYGAKIGAKELVCSECGIVVSRGVRSYPESAVDDYRCGSSGMSW